MKELAKEFKELEKKLGIDAYNEITKFMFTLYRKIEDLTISRDKWREKFEELKKEVKNET